MSQSWITCARPATAPAQGYDETAEKPGVVWRLRLPIGATREVEILGLDQVQAVELASNNPGVVPNGQFDLRRTAERWTARITGKQIGTTLINAGFTPPAGGGVAGFGAMPIGPGWGPVVLQVQVTRPDGSMPGNDIGVVPEGQLDSNACWAACLAWWTRAVPGALTRHQRDLILEGRKKALPDGTLEAGPLLSFFSSQATLRAELVPPGNLPRVLAARNFPMIIGFASGPMGGHVNVIHAFNEAKGTVTVMEPWFPDPVGNRSFGVDDSGAMPRYFTIRDGKDFTFTGKHLVRAAAHYQTRPLQGKLLIAYSSSQPIIPSN